MTFKVIITEVNNPIIHDMKNLYIVYLYMLAKMKFCFYLEYFPIALRVEPHSAVM